MHYIPIEELENGMMLARDVFPHGGDYIPLLTKGQCLNPTFIRRLYVYGIKGVYIQENFSAETSSPTINQPVHKEALASIENVFRAIRENTKADSVQAIQQLDVVIDNLADTLLKNSNTLINIDHLKSYDDYTYHHSVNVAILSMAIGTFFDLPKEDLEKLGKSAILHDIGKTRIPIDLIHKPGKLTSNEFEEIKHHSQCGYDCLMENGQEMSDVPKIVLHHHEKFDGSGYPSGLQGEEIPFFSRIISVADVYDALTSHRPYRSPIQPISATEYIMGGCDTYFDSQIIDAFLHRIELYRIGSYVKLSNGAIGQVIGYEQQLRPILRLYPSEKIIDLYHDPKYLNIVIRGTCHPPRKRENKFNL